jgi:hypothetical protein
MQKLIVCNLVSSGCFTADGAGVNGRNRLHGGDLRARLGSAPAGALVA